MSDAPRFAPGPTPADPVLAATLWKSNADLIADVARLGYLKDEWVTLDPTYGRGNWWKKWRPNKLVTCTNRSVDETPEADRHDVDFRALPFDDAAFDAVAYDPPYVAVGGRRTSTLGGGNDRRGGSEFHDRYGLTDAPQRPIELQALINSGLTEMHRVVRPGGFVLVKCQDYICAGQLFPGTHLTLTHGLDLGFKYFDRLEHVSASPRPQPPSNRRQVHARRNLSTLLVFRKPVRSLTSNGSRVTTA